MQKTLKEKLNDIDKKLQSAITKGFVTLVAVTKYASDEQVCEAYDLGLRDFGENYVLPALKRQERLKSYFKDQVRWHLLGPLQSNKVNKAVGNFDLIQSVSSFELAKLIDQRASKLGLVQDVLIQINSTGDKNGFGLAEFEAEINEMLKLKNLNLKGLMTMGPLNISEKTETIYSELRHSLRVLPMAGPGHSYELSMGMSHDYEIAYQEGATMIRVGRELFEIEEGS